MRRSKLGVARADALRDKFTSLQRLVTHLARIQEATRQSCVYPVASATGADLWYVIHGGRVRAVLPAPHDAASQRQAAALLETIYAQPLKEGGSLSLDEIDRVLLVASWFRRHCAERQRKLTLEEALQLCDG